MPPTTPPLKPEILTDADLRSDELLKHLERLAWLMDRAFTIPGTKISVGLDALIGLVPGLGDFLCGLIQTGLVLTAVQNYRLPKVVAARMAVNVLIDLTVGTIPFVGDAFDVGFKANTRNVKLLHEVRKLQSQGHPVPSAPSAWFLVGIGVALVSALLLLLVGLLAFVKLVWNALPG